MNTESIHCKMDAFYLFPDDRKYRFSRQCAAALHCRLICYLYNLLEEKYSLLFEMAVYFLHFVIYHFRQCTVGLERYFDLNIHYAGHKLSVW